MNLDFTYDLETYWNMFSACIVHNETKTRWIFEVSDRRNQAAQFIEFVFWLREIGARMVGFNNEGFDWPVVDHCVKIGVNFTARDAYDKAQAIIDAQNNDRFGQMIWADQRIVPQVDLFKIHHFDNRSKSTSLKKLEINMRSASVIDLPYSPHDDLTHAQMDEVIDYMCHDVNETIRFYDHSREQIRFRDELPKDLGDVVNFNDTKIGKKYFEKALEAASPGSTVEWVGGKKRPRQTHRQTIAIADIISPKVAFHHPALRRVHEWLGQQVLTRTQIEDALSDKVETKGVFKGLVASVDGFDFVFGAGGIHGSLTGVSVHADDDHDIIDFDVASYYPSLAISGGHAPAHLGAQFPVIYRELFERRQKLDKKSGESAMLKLAMNGVYGDSNSIYGCFFDTQYTMTITINGQLLLCMFAENCLYYQGQRVPGVTIIQANTDGITLKVRKDQRPFIMAVADWWQGHTGLVLENVDYSAMHIRDVNSYMAVKKKDGSVKRIGAYAYVTPIEDPFTRELGWHKDHSMRVVAMAAEAQMVRGIPVADFIMAHRDPFDFMLSIKVPRSSRLEADGVPVQNTTRYYISTRGVYLRKIMPPLKNAKATEYAITNYDGTTTVAAGGVGPERSFDVQKGWTVGICNNAADFDWSTLNYLYYIEEARKLLI